MYLISFTPFQPSPGLAFWSLIIFLAFWILIGKLAFKPIANSLKKRESGIADALASAEKAREEMSKLQAQNESLLAEAREEKMQILAEARDMKNSIIEEAKTKAKDEANKIIADASRQIEAQKVAAITDVKNEVGSLAISVAERLVKENLKDDQNQNQLVQSLLKDISLS